MTDYRLSRRAKSDLDDIFEYTIDQFGLRQAILYRDSLKDCFSLIADNPGMGRRADELGNGVRRHVHRSHIVFYVAKASGVTIVAITHGRRVTALKL